MTTVHLHSESEWMETDNGEGGGACNADAIDLASVLFSCLVFTNIVSKREKGEGPGHGGRL